MAGGLRLALTMLTVVPLPARPVSRASAAAAMSMAPAVGVALGFVLAAVGLGLTTAGASTLLAAVLVVAAGVAATRALHLDGLADTADALGSYADPPTALAIMRKPDVGPFGVAAVVLALLAQTAAAASVLSRPWLPALAGVVVATAAGRLGIAYACRRTVPAARPDGLGALVAGTVGPVPLGLATVTLAVVAVAAVPDRPWQGPLAVVLAVAVVLALVRHVVRRLGGVTGDVLGAVCEVAVTATYVAVSI